MEYEKNLFMENYKLTNVTKLLPFELKGPVTTTCRYSELHACLNVLITIYFNPLFIHTSTVKVVRKLPINAQLMIFN
jgi:hypothetical protein